MYTIEVILSVPLDLNYVLLSNGDSSISQGEWTACLGVATGQIREPTPSDGHILLAFRN